MQGSFWNQLFPGVISPGQQLSIFTLPGRASRRFDSAEAAEKYVASLPASADVYHGVGLVRDVASGRGTAADVVTLGALWADIDMAGGPHKENLPASLEEVLSILPLPPSALVHSGNGVHAYWFLGSPWMFEKGDKEPANLARAWHGLVCEAGLRRGWKLENLGDLARVLRTPGTQNNKPGGPKPVVLLECSGVRYSRAELASLLPRPAAPVARVFVPYTGTLSPLERCCRYLDEIPDAIEGAGGGTNTFRAAKAIAGFGLEGAEARAAFEHYNKRAVPPWTNEKQIEHKLKQGRQHEEFGRLARESFPDLDWEVDLSFLLDPSQDRPEDADDDEFCSSMVPPDGLIREIFEFYSRSIYRQCPVFALATSIAILQTIFGRKVESETGLRTNDYHLILAPTTSGKEGTLTAVNRLLTGAGAAQRILPEKMQSGNGLLAAVRDVPASIWVCDEFGYVLQSILDKKRGDINARAIGGILLSLYGKSNSKFTGSAYAGKKDHEIDQPHLCVLGVSTGYTVFSEITQGQVMDGMLGRVAFWSVQSRPKPNRNLDQSEPVDLCARLAAWEKFTPSGGNIDGVVSPPSVLRIPFSAAARRRWHEHEDKIDLRMENERAVRSALWGRTAARSMKLALVHRLARLSSPAELNEFSSVEVELTDVNWGIAVSNWNTRLACSLIGEQVADSVGASVQKKVQAIIEKAGQITQRQICRALRSSDKGQISAAINELEQQGKVTTWLEKKRGEPSRVVKWGTVAPVAEIGGQI